MSMTIDKSKFLKAIFDIGPHEEYLPLAYRIDKEGLIYYEDPYIVIRLHDIADIWASWLAFGKTFHFGTYEWKARLVEPVMDATIILGVLEKRHGWADEGIIALKHAGSDHKYYFVTSSEAKGGTGNETTEITAIDFTVEHTFKIEWTSTYVKFYIDDVLKATHTTKVPQDPMQLFAEVATIGAPGVEPECHFKNKSFKEI